MCMLGDFALSYKGQLSLRFTGVFWSSRLGFLFAGKSEEGSGRVLSNQEGKQQLSSSRTFFLLKTRMANCGSCFWCIIWLMVLLCIGWPLSITLGGLYGLISPLTTCLGLDRLSDLLLEGANVGRTCANNMRHCKPLC
ncbi:hypothetical protein ATANTOWER_010799 [Ataeniobius toweri]|uniref:Uncharacterized protein n=1 Tax=Ataeniobius toweri TaxID=208326 RepID=A0ABU7AB10_9TELE|nr:hypothetical protein [Ataeniobius toweri]